LGKSLNNYFASVFTLEDTENLPKIEGNLEANGSEELKEMNISKAIELEKLIGLKNDKSPGPDGLHPRVLKEVAAEKMDPLFLIFQNSLDSGMVPSDWKVANVMPIFKKEGRQKMGNYRPVSLISVVGKILESLFSHGVLRKS
uniref:Reverse transcriptase domain-containing protein n=1 Tax=Callorhinchus milii TaxID=7868 RepID=A0A4W3K5J0_CALMI